MISRRNFFTITILMTTVLFLCMCLNNLKDSWNDYAVNTYTETAENYPSRVNIYIPGDSEEEETAKGDTEENPEGTVVIARNKVICIGDEETILMKVTRQWVGYTKRNTAGYPSLAAYRKAGEGAEQPEMLVIDSACVDWDSEEEMDFLTACVEDGSHLVFCNLPEVSVIKNNARARELLGIRKVREEETRVAGFHLSDGFLLGGETIYLERENQEDGTSEGKNLSPEESFPGDLSMPWYLPASGTKVYMKGIPEEGSVKPEDYPIVMWRKSFGNAYVFAVNGGFMDGIQAMGILSAMSSEMYSYEIYPVLNSQNVILAGYPGVADENGEEMERIYSRSLKQVFQEIVLSGVNTVLQKCEYRATCMMTPQYDYEDDNVPDGKQFRYYLKVLKEQTAEIGLCALNRSGTSAAEKLKEDTAFLQEAVGGYEIVSFYADSMTEEEIDKALEEEVLSSTRTVVRAYDPENAEVIGFLSEYVTGQSTLGDGMQYTCKDDFLVKCMETALGYFSVSFDMSRVAYPETEGDRWERMSQTFAANLAAYSQAFPGFESTTAAECDIRIRQFLALEHKDSRIDDTIRLTVDGAGGGTVWFVLRTHNEAIKEMEGGSWQKLEENAYLLRIDDSQVTITLEPGDERHYR